MNEHAELQRDIIAGLDRLIWEPPPGVRDLDRVEAVQLLGQFHHPAATQSLGRVLDEATGRIQPRPLGHLLRDTALDTLLRAPAQRGADTTQVLARYYSFWRRILHGRLERNVIYDDLPVLVRHGQAGLVLRVYVLPLLGVLLALVALPEILGALLGNSLGGLSSLIGLLFFVGLGLFTFNLHQVLLVLLVAFVGERLPLPMIPGLRRKTIASTVLAVAGLSLTLFTALYILRNASSFGPPDQFTVTVLLVLLPLLVIPCYMLAHDLEDQAANIAAERPARRLSRVALTLRAVSATIYVVYVLTAFGLNFLVLAHDRGTVSDLDVLLASLPYWLYLLVAPVLVLVLLAGLGRLQRRGPARPSPVEAPT